MPKPALQASELSKNFGGLVAVDRVNLELNHVEVHAVIGPNGAGKTTLLSMLAGELSPSAGRIKRRSARSRFSDFRVSCTATTGSSGPLSWPCARSICSRAIRWQPSSKVSASLKRKAMRMLGFVVG